MCGRSWASQQKKDLLGITYSGIKIWKEAGKVSGQSIYIYIATGMGMLKLALKVIYSVKCVKVTSEIYKKIEAQGNCNERQEDMLKGRKVTGETIYMYIYIYDKWHRNCKLH